MSTRGFVATKALAMSRHAVRIGNTSNVANCKVAERIGIVIEQQLGKMRKVICNINISHNQLEGLLHD